MILTFSCCCSSKWLRFTGGSHQDCFESSGWNAICRNIIFGVNADYIVIRLWRVIFQTNLFLFPSASSIKTQSGGFMFELVPNPCHVTCRDHHVFYMYPCPGDTLGSAIWRKFTMASTVSWGQKLPNETVLSGFDSLPSLQFAVGHIKVNQWLVHGQTRNGTQMEFLWGPHMQKRKEYILLLSLKEMYHNIHRSQQNTIAVQQCCKKQSKTDAFVRQTVRISARRLLWNN